MTHLAFIRSEACHDCWDYFEARTEVLIFGDAKGYDYLRRQLLKATRAKDKDNIHLSLLEQHPTSMMGVILPPARAKRAAALLKFIERYVPGKSGPNMELVIFGNRAGYLHLAEKLGVLKREFMGQPSGHIHLDDLVDRRVVPRSVALNLRGPVRYWTRKGFGEYAGLVLNKSKCFLPADISTYRDVQEKYEETSANKSGFLNLQPGVQPADRRRR